ncbi:MAG: FCD domain-containing protein [Desulfobacteraceae bacterium]|nr:FCD domain-containing protein [Desulfobacteraceae bacterium]
MPTLSASPMKFDAIRLPSAPEALAEQIVERIRSGKLTPGTCLPSQRELARAFQVGLGSVREAIKILNVMGYLEVIRGKGTFIAKDVLDSAKGLSPFDKAMEAVSLAELMRAREVVECGAARLAAAHADAENIERLKAVTSRMRRDSGDLDAYYQNDFAFHLSVAAASNNPAICEIVKLLVDKSHHHIGFMNESLGISMPVNVQRCVDTAQTVVSCIEQGDGERSSEAMREHLNIVGMELERGFLRQT